jgi:glycosyltransferase involved in cell wall biosynthesis
MFNRLSYDQTGKRVNFSRPYILQVSRFDPSKGTHLGKELILILGIPDAIRAYAQLRKRIDVELPLSQIPQLIIAGHGSIDDPDGAVVFEDILGMLEDEEFANINYDVIVVRYVSYHCL